jgi:hypothetical protein
MRKHCRESSRNFLDRNGPGRAGPGRKNDGPGWAGPAFVVARTGRAGPGPEDDGPGRAENFRPVLSSNCNFGHRVCTRAENGPKIFGPARRPPGPARPVRATTKAGPARRFCGPARSGPENFGNFPYNDCASFFTCLFSYRSICFSGYFYRIIYVFIVLSMFRGTFRKFLIRISNHPL